MATDIINAYNIELPELSDIANMQQAFYKYHFGTDDYPTDDSQITDTSVVGYLSNVIQQAQAIVDDTAVVIQISTETDLNSLTGAGNGGNYLAVTVPADKNYPSNVAGLLRVVITTAGTAKFVFQTYQTIASGTAGNNSFWRSAYNASGTITDSDWTAWKKAQNDPHDHDNLYYQKSVIDSRIDSSINSSSVVVTDNTGKITSNSIISIADLQTLEDINVGDTRTIAARLADKANASHNHDDLYHRKDSQPRIYVRSTTPTGASIGDLWFW